MFKPQRIMFATALVALATVVAACGSATATTHNVAATHPIPMASNKTTLRLLKSTIVGYTSHSIIVTASGHAVYELSGDSAKHPKCDDSSCLSAWPAVTAKHPSDKGVKGKLGVWHHKGIYQVTLNGRPLYTYLGDSSARTANGNGQQSYGGTWWVLSSSGSWFTSKASSGGGGSGW